MLHMEWCNILNFVLNYLLDFDTTNEECVCVQHDIAISI
jgi:hypothetical protein